MTAGGADKSPRRATVIAIDGPAAAGKGTLARRLAAWLDYAYLDTGSLYRAVGLALLRSGLDPADETKAAGVAKTLDPALLADPALRSEAVGEAASKVAALPAVREALLAFQRDFAQNPPDGRAGAVLDGRDIGTVVCPDAAIKLFVTADLPTRAQRRFDELKAKDPAVSYDAVLADLAARDARDAARSTAPLRKAEDAYLLDTTNSDIDSVFNAALALIEARISQDPED